MVGVKKFSFQAGKVERPLSGLVPSELVLIVVIQIRSN